LTTLNVNEFSTTTKKRNRLRMPAGAIEKWSNLSGNSLWNAAAMRKISVVSGDGPFVAIFGQGPVTITPDATLEL
jgi:hypothetical protein